MIRAAVHRAGRLLRVEHWKHSSIITPGCSIIFPYRTSSTAHLHSVSISRPHRMHKVQTIAIDDPGRLSVCLSRGFAVQTRINGSRSCLVWRLKGHCVRRKSRLPHGFDAAFAKLLWLLVYLVELHVRIIVRTLDIAPLHENLTSRRAQIDSTRCRGISQFYLHTHTFIHKRIEPHLPPQPQMVLIKCSKMMED